MLMWAHMVPEWAVPQAMATNGTASADGCIDPDRSLTSVVAWRRNTLRICKAPDST